jgi:capsid portal protein
MWEGFTIFPKLIAIAAVSDTSLSTMPITALRSRVCEVPLEIAAPEGDTTVTESHVQLLLDFKNHLKEVKYDLNLLQS